MGINNITVVICCAGLGSRLGIGTTKALLDIDGKPLILRQLELLKDFDDIRIVVGHQAKKVIDVVNNYRKDIMFVFNYDYASTGPAVSLSKGLLGAREYIISIDGDLLINPKEFEKIINVISNFDKEYIVISKILSTHPNRVKLKDDKVVGFSEDGTYDWTGFVKVKRVNLEKPHTYIHQMFKKALPLEYLILDTIGIDTIEDYKRATEWGKRVYV